MSDEVHSTIRTKELRLVDQSGQDKAVLAVDDQGCVNLTFLDGSDSPRIKIGVDNTGRALFQIGRGVGVPNLSLGVDKDGKILIEATDNNGIERVKFELKGNGSHTELAFSEKSRRPRMVIMAEDKGPAGLFILDQHGKALFSTTP